MSELRARLPTLKLDWATHQAAEYAVKHWHYSKRMPKSKLVKIGVWEDEIFMGVVIFGIGATSDLVKRYDLDPTQGCELVRIALDRKHQTPVTRIVSIAIKLFRKLCPGIRLIVSFADPEHGHHGGIYQGGGWIYAGRTQASNEYIFKGRRWQGRAFRHKFKGMEKDPRVTVVKGSSKYRYLMPLDQEIRSRVESLRESAPKRAGSKEIVASGFQSEEGGENPTPALQPATRAASY